MGALYTPGTMVLPRPLADQQPTSAASQRHVPELGPVPHAFYPDLQHDEALTKGSRVFARPSFSSPVALGRIKGPSA